MADFGLGPVVVSCFEVFAVDGDCLGGLRECAAGHPVLACVDAWVDCEVPAAALDAGLDVADFFFEVDNLLLEFGVLVVDVGFVDGLT